VRPTRKPARVKPDRDHPAPLPEMAFVPVEA
jgi:hypothetical protein